MNSSLSQQPRTGQPASAVSDRSAMTARVVILLDLLRKAIENRDLNVDSCATLMQTDRSNLNKQVNAERPMSLERFAEFPDDVLGEFGALLAEWHGRMVVVPLDPEQTMRALVTGALSWMAHQQRGDRTDRMPAKSNGQLKVETEQRQPQDRRKSA